MMGFEGAIKMWLLWGGLGIAVFVLAVFLLAMWMRIRKQVKEKKRPPWYV